MGGQGRAGTRFEKAHLQMASARECTLPLLVQIASRLPPGDQSKIRYLAPSGHLMQNLTGTCETRTVQHISAQRRQGSGAGTWRVGAFEFGYLLQCGGGSAGREACNVPLGWTTGSSSLLAGVLLRLGQIAGRDFEGSSSSRWQSSSCGVQVVDPVCETINGPSGGEMLSSSTI